MQCEEKQAVTVSVYSCVVTKKARHGTVYKGEIGNAYIPTRFDERNIRLK